MKIFISHSSRDKWIARKISEEINDLECTTFLDEKDILTGQSIDTEISSHLTESDDFLLLLSPDSIKSHWVLIELGGALALKKRIIIILLYLGTNDIPQPISKYLARDINEIEQYYEEIKKRLSGKKIRLPKEKATVKEIFLKQYKSNYKIGDIVRLPQEKPKNIRHVIGWDEENKMSQYLGKESEVIEINKDAKFVRVKEDNGEFAWAFEWLTDIN